MGRVDYVQGALAEMSDFFTKRLYINLKENSNFGWKTKSSGRNTEVALWG